MLELIKGFVNRVISDPRDIVKSNAEILVIRHPSGERSVVNSYPAASKTLRGSGGDVLWLEEAAFMPEALFFEVVLPLLEVEKTSMLAISTPSPDGSLNFYTSMMATKNANGEPMFKCLTIAMACEECLKQGLASSCTHMESFRPPWKSASKFSMVKAIYSQNKGMYVWNTRQNHTVYSRKPSFPVYTLRYAGKREHGFEHGGRGRRISAAGGGAVHDAHDSAAPGVSVFAMLYGSFGGRRLLHEFGHALSAPESYFHHRDRRATDQGGGADGEHAVVPRGGGAHLLPAALDDFCL